LLIFPFLLFNLIASSLTAESENVSLRELGSVHCSVVEPRRGEIFVASFVFCLTYNVAWSGVVAGWGAIFGREILIFVRMMTIEPLPLLSNLGVF